MTKQVTALAMERNFIIILSLNSLRKANAAANLLQDEGLEVYVDIEDVGAAWIGEVREGKPFHLVVPEEEADEARLILAIEEEEGNRFRD